MVVWISIAAACWASVWSAIAIRNLPKRSLWRKYCTVSLIHSIFYIFAFSALKIYPDIDRAAWSKALTPVSISVFIVIWSGPPILLRLTHLEKERETKRILKDSF